MPDVPDVPDAALWKRLGNLDKKIETQKTKRTSKTTGGGARKRRGHSARRGLTTMSLWVPSLYPT